MQVDISFVMHAFIIPLNHRSQEFIYGQKKFNLTQESREITVLYIYNKLSTCTYYLKSDS